MKIAMTEAGEIIMPASELALFARKKKKRASSDFYASSESFGDAEMITSLSYRTIKNGEVFIITGEANGIYTFGNECTVEMIKPVKKVSASSDPHSDPVFLAEAYVCAFLVCKTKRRDSVTLKLTLRGENNDKHFDIKLDLSLLTRVTDSLLDRAAPFAEVRKNFELRGKRDISTMPFPYPSIREGQLDFIKEAYRSIKKGSRLIVSAPTGIGKTVSALFPAVKAIGDGNIEKVFYLTAKTVTGLSAASTVRAMNRSVPDLRAVIITAKERICPSNDKKNTFFVEKCSYLCPRLNDSEDDSYSERRDAALKELLSEKKVFEKCDIYEAAEKHFLCPYELSLDLSEYCQVVICDYNYVFDSKVRFRRYFCEGSLRYALLIDEAHNLPDRTREMYSSKLDIDDFRRLCRLIKQKAPHEGSLLISVENLLASLEAAGEKCSENAELSGGEKNGYLLLDHIPKSFSKPLEELSPMLYKAMNTFDDDELSSSAEKVHSDISEFLRSTEFFDEHFTFFTEMHGDALTFRTMCLDPSSIIDTAMKGAVSSIMFSATLTPVEYFAHVTGSDGASVLELESPYDTDNLCIGAVDTVSTKYIAREDTAEEIADMILAVTEAKSGHYIVYFPSYKYMQTVVKAFLASAPENISAVVQKSGMSLDARNRFLSFFENDDGGKTLVGFCVLGGVFSEGIDLPDEKLIGALLVGIGLPGLSSELNILKDYYDRTTEEGYNYAYLYPAMIKIQQAGGRVIRSENDKGVVILIDDRYRDPSIIRLLPPHWKDIHYIGDAHSLSRYLERFWNRHKKNGDT